MNRVLFLLVVFSSVTLCNTLQAQNQLKRVEPTKYLSLDIPIHFSRLSEEQALKLFPSNRIPIAAYADPGSRAVFGINKSTTRWREADLDMLQGFYKSNIFSLHDSVTILSEGLYEVNGKRQVFFEFNSIVEGDKESINSSEDIWKYNYIQYAIIDNYVFIFNFFSNSSLKRDYQQDIKAMMKTIKFGKKIK